METQATDTRNGEGPGVSSAKELWAGDLAAAPHGEAHRALRGFGSFPPESLTTQGPPPTATGQGGRGSGGKGGCPPPWSPGPSPELSTHSEEGGGAPGYRASVPTCTLSLRVHTQQPHTHSHAHTVTAAPPAQVVTQKPPSRQPRPGVGHVTVSSLLLLVTSLHTMSVINQSAIPRRPSESPAPSL